MKKLSFLLVACTFALLATMPTQAQRVDIKGINEALTKLDADSEDPKKGVKASTWLKRADAYYNSTKDPVKSIYVGAPMSAIKTTYGKERKMEKVTIGGRELEAWTYNFAIIYAVDSRVTAWKVTREVKRGAMRTAMTSYAKAAEIDPAALAKAEKGLDKINDHYRELGNVLGSIQDYTGAAVAYLEANRAMTSINKKNNDANLLYLAGYLYLVDGAKNQKSYAQAERNLNAALRAGYNKIEAQDDSVPAEEKGKIYHYIYYSIINGAAELNEKRLTSIKNLMLKAVKEYPNNEDVMTDLMNLYTKYPELGSPDEVLTMIEKALVQNPDNISVWYSRGRVYATMNNYDECIKSFEQVVRLDPEGFNGYFYQGLFYTSKADEYNEVMRDKTYKKQAEYDADFKTLCDKYKEALPFLEKAISINPEDETTLEYLKSIYFRLREESGMMEKYNTYNDKLKALRE